MAHSTVVANPQSMYSPWSTSLPPSHSAQTAQLGGQEKSFTDNETAHLKVDVHKAVASSFTQIQHTHSNESAPLASTSLHQWKAVRSGQPTYVARPSNIVASPSSNPSAEDDNNAISPGGCDVRPTSAAPARPPCWRGATFRQDYLGYV